MSTATAKPRKLTAAQSAILQELNEVRAMVSSDLLDRRRIGSALGRQYDGERLIYTTLGYKKEPTFTDYEAYYRRHEIAKGVIKAPVDASWETFPTIEESDEKDTKFEKDAADIITRLKLQKAFSRLDTLSGLGNYAVLLLGFADNAPLETPVTSAKKILFATPYPQTSAVIASTEQNNQNDRFGLPVTYNITVGTSSKHTTYTVHYTRVIHVAQECLTNQIEGTPQLEVVFNRLMDIEKLVGADAEAFWRLADPGMTLKVDKEFQVTPSDKETYEEKVLDFIHRMKKFLILQGVEAHALEQQVADPLNHFNILMDMVAAGKRIPKRILLGSELGELASTMDLVRWFRSIKSRREQFCEPDIIRPFFDRLIQVGVLTRDQKVPYNVKWDDLLTPSDKEKADVGAVRATALANYINSGGPNYVPEEVFLGWLGLSPEEIERIMKDMSTRLEDEPEPESTPQPGDETDDADDTGGSPPNADAGN